MTIKVAINGFGRIGRMVFRAGLNDKKIEFVAINDLADINQIAYLLNQDSAHGKLDKKVSVRGKNLVVNGKVIKFYCEKNPEQLPWKDLNIDVVVESTGIFRNYDGAMKHIRAGAKKVLVSAPFKDECKKEMLTLVKGVNEKMYKGQKIVSCASCTTNCVAPIIKVMNDKFGVQNVVFTTIHAYTVSQKMVDSYSKDYRRGRAAAVNIIPTTTGASVATELAIPKLKGKIFGKSVRVPVVDGSLTDFSFSLKKKATVEKINSVMKDASKKEMKGIIEYCIDPIVSSDIIGNEKSVVFDSLLTEVCGNTVKVFAWYDNEWGYSNRMIDVIKLIK